MEELAAAKEGVAAKVVTAVRAEVPQAAAAAALAVDRTCREGPGRQPQMDARSATPTTRASALGATAAVSHTSAGSATVPTWGRTTVPEERPRVQGRDWSGAERPRREKPPSKLTSFHPGCRRRRALLRERWRPRGVPTFQLRSSLVSLRDQINLHRVGACRLHRLRLFHRIRLPRPPAQRRNQFLHLVRGLRSRSGRTFDWTRTLHVPVWTARPGRRFHRIQPHRARTRTCLGPKWLSRQLLRQPFTTAPGRQTAVATPLTSE